MPYYLNNEHSPDAEVEELVRLRAESEAYITNVILGCKSHSQDSSAASSTRLNQIALLAMLATKGSVSNLIQCSHSLVQGTTRVGHCNRSANCFRIPTAADGLQSGVPARPGIQWVSRIPRPPLGRVLHRTQSGV